MSDARDAGLIRRRNILKLDSKINAKLNKFVKANDILPTLPDRLAQADREQRNLPAAISFGVPSESARPAQVDECFAEDYSLEQRRLHSFFFGFAASGSGENLAFLPESLRTEE